MRLDHVVWAVRDLDAAAAAFRERFGLGSVPGGRHRAWGTGNRIVPLGGSYVELLAALDPGAARSALGREVMARTARGDGPMTWCVAPDDLEATAARLGLAVTEGARALPDGTVLRWRSAGLERALARPPLPFFIQWEVGDALHPGRASARHAVRPLGLSWVEVGGDSAELRDWLGGADLPVRVVPGEPGIRAVGVATEAGEVVLT